MTESPLPRHLLVVTILLLTPLLAQADVVSSVNKVRAHGCSGSPGGEVFLRQTRQLDAVAQQLARGTRVAGSASQAARAAASALQRLSAAKGRVETPS